MKTLLVAIALTLAGCGSAISQSVPAVAPCEYKESLAPYCLDATGLTCYGADAVEYANDAIVCIWRCVEFQGFHQDVYGVFNPEPTLHLDTMIATGPAAQCD